MDDCFVWYSVFDDEIYENALSPKRVLLDCLKPGAYLKEVVFQKEGDVLRMAVKFDTGEIFIYLGPL